MRTQHPFRGGWLHRLSVGRCYHAPAQRSRVHFIQDVVLNGQVAFHQLTGNRDVRQCLENALDGMLDELRIVRGIGVARMVVVTAERDEHIEHAQVVDGPVLTTRENQGLPGWGYTSCPFILHPGPIRHNTRVDARHSFGALTSYMALYYRGSISKDSEFLRRVHALLPRSGSLFDARLPTRGKMFAQSTRSVPNTMYYANHLRQSAR